MRPRKYRLPPPPSSNYKSGLVLTWAPSANDPLPSEMVELVPVGPEPLVLEALPESVPALRVPADAIGESKTAVVAAVVNMVEMIAPSTGKRQAIEAAARDFVEQLARVVASSPPELPQK